MEQQLRRPFLWIEGVDTDEERIVLSTAAINVRQLASVVFVPDWKPSDPPERVPRPGLAVCKLPDGTAYTIKDPATIRRLEAYLRALSDDLAQVADPAAPPEPEWR